MTTISRIALPVLIAVTVGAGGAIYYQYGQAARDADATQAISQLTEATPQPSVNPASVQASDSVDAATAAFLSDTSDGTSTQVAEISGGQESSVSPDLEQQFASQE